MSLKDLENSSASWNSPERGAALLLTLVCVLIIDGVGDGIVWSATNSTKRNFKYININKQREASISSKHLQINTWFWPLTFSKPKLSICWNRFERKIKGDCWKRKVERDNTSCTTQSTKHAQCKNSLKKGCYCTSWYWQYTKSSNWFCSYECYACVLLDKLSDCMNSFK